MLRQLFNNLRVKNRPEPEKQADTENQLPTDNKKNTEDAFINKLLQSGYEQQQLGAYDEAEVYYKQILAKQPGNVDALFLSGQINGIQGNYGVAVQLLEQSITRKSDFADAHAILGNVYAFMEEFHKAVSCYQRAITINPDLAMAHGNLGVALRELKLYEQAIASFREAVRLQPDFAEAHNNLGITLNLMDDVQGALASFRAAHKIQPDHIETLNGLVTALNANDQHEEAITILKEKLVRRPDFAEAHTGLGYIYHAMALFEDAVASYRTALSCNPELPEALNNMGIVLQDLGNLDEAITYYSNALKYKPDFPQAQWHRSLAYLLRGEFGTGWPDYEIRLISQTPPPREFPYPRWHGEPIPDCSLLIYAEQGIGDEIMFLSCLPDVLEHVGHCVVDCHKKLAPLLKRSFPAITVHGGAQKSTDRSWLDDMPNIDYAIPIGSLPQFYRKELKDFPLHKGYLQAEPERVQYWRERLNQLGTGLKIGISWTGGTKKTRSALRSIPLEQWLPLLNQQDVQFVNLQYTDCKQELEDIRTQHGITITHWQEAIDNYDETAALVSALDLVISVQTALIHLGGALGCPVWVMVPVCPEWRYLNKGSDMPWYPSVHIFRQNRLWKWADVIQEVAHKLQQQLQSPDTPLN